MFISGAVLVLASYVGPHASPNSNLYQTEQERNRILRNHSDYARPGMDRNYAPPPEPKVESPKPGRMVVPKKFL